MTYYNFYVYLRISMKYEHYIFLALFSSYFRWFMRLDCLTVIPSTFLNIDIFEEKLFVFFTFIIWIKKIIGETIFKLTCGYSICYYCPGMFSTLFRRFVRPKSSRDILLVFFSKIHFLTKLFFYFLFNIIPEPVLDLSTRTWHCLLAWRESV